MSKKQGQEGRRRDTRWSPRWRPPAGCSCCARCWPTAWTKVTGKEPPTDLTDPKVTLPEALAWAVATGVDRGDGAVRDRARHDAQRRRSALTE